jgi:hypothetical protein
MKYKPLQRPLASLLAHDSQGLKSQPVSTARKI